MAEENLAAKSFGFYVFDDKAMEKHVPDSAYKQMKLTILKGGQLDANVADAVAFGMKEWATEKGASCFTHWFHPLTNKTGVKYDAFLTLKNHLGYSGRNLSQFTGKQLVQGEPDGSSFPSGGLRKTSEARGYTAWDYTSPPFVMVDSLGGCLYIPAVFCSIFGLSLDLRTPMLKSEYSISQQSLRALELINSCLVTPGAVPKSLPSAVYCTMGPEQEFFLVDRGQWLKRQDLVTTGRILVGCPPLKGQQLDDHYWGTMPLRVKQFIGDAQRRLWELGVPIVTAHNEVAPAQFEMAACYERASVASDHNMVTMAVLEDEAEKHGLACLFHEKPFFRYVNGSGKHTNWSLATSDGENLLAPGSDPAKSAQFLFFLAAFLRGVHVHSDVLRSAIAVPGNEFRLGGMEAPPAIISVFIGTMLDRVIGDVIEGKQSDKSSSSPDVLDLGLASLPQLQLDSTDRNRTSPLAFVGNRFEFRAVGSSQNCAWPVTAMNTIMAESLASMCQELEAEVAKGATKKDALRNVIRETLQKHRDIIYNGDCYEQEYVEEMTKHRGLPNIPTCAASYSSWNTQKNRELFSSMNVMTPAEVEAREHVWAEHYVKVRTIEANTLIYLVERTILPAVQNYVRALASTLRDTVAVLGENAAPAQKERLAAIVGAIEKATTESTHLRELVAKGDDVEEGIKRSTYFHDEIMSSMERVKDACDILERFVDKACWPIPTLTDIVSLF